MTIITGCVLIALVVGPGQTGAGPTGDGQVDLESLIERAMDEIVDFEVNNMPVREAFSFVADQSGVPLTIKSEVLRLLPYGAETRMTAKMRNVPLREGIKLLVEPLGMRCQVVGDHVEVQPREALLRIGRRATWDELATLEWLGKVEWVQGSEDMDELHRRTQFLFDARAREAPADQLSAAIARVGAGSGDEVLTLAARSLGWTWYPWGKHIAVIPAIGQTYRELQRPVRLHVERQPLGNVLLELARLSRVKLKIEPGAIAALPREAREDFSLLVDGVSLEQALEVIAGATGLAFEVEPDGVVIYRPDATESNAPPALRVADDPIVGRVSMPGKDGEYQYEFVIRRSDLPPHIDRRRLELIDEVIEAMRRVPAPPRQDAP